MGHPVLFQDKKELSTLLSSCGFAPNFRRILYFNNKPSTSHLGRKRLSAIDKASLKFEQWPTVGGSECMTTGRGEDHQRHIGAAGSAKAHNVQPCHTAIVPADDGYAETQTFSPAALARTAQCQNSGTKRETWTSGCALRPEDTPPTGRAGYFSHLTPSPYSPYLGAWSGMFVLVRLLTQSSENDPELIVCELHRRQN